MPLYDYVCEGCGEEVTHMLPMSERNDPPACTKCPSDVLKRVISGGHFELKGTGWYKTDYRHK